MTDSIENSNVSANEYKKTILNRIKDLLSKTGVSQKELGEACGMSPAGMSKLLAGKSALTVNTAYQICKVLDIKPEILLSSTDEFKIYDNISLLNKSSSDDEDSFISNPNRRAFKGIINDRYDSEDYYFFYAKPTISNEKNSFLKGRFSMTASEDNESCCAKLVLKTGKKDKNGLDIEKEFIGQTVISLPMKACCSFLKSDKYGDMAFIVFSHMFLNDTPLLTRIAGALTISAGANRRPVFEKCIITRVPLTDDQLNEIQGQLFINSSLISIRKNILDNQDNFKNEYALLEKADIDLDRFTTAYYNIEESQIRSSQHLSAYEKMELIHKLRRISDAPCYAKVSGRADELLFDWMTSIETALNKNERPKTEC